MYLTRNRRQNNDQMGTMDSYIKAYKLSHESYQSKQEEDTSKIAEENEKILTSRSKREASADPPHEKDFIKFELTDAIQPDSDTLKNRKVSVGKNLRLPFEIADTHVVFGNKTKGETVQKPSINNTSTEPSPVTNSTTAKSQRTRRRRVRKDRSDAEGVQSAKVKRDSENDMENSESRKVKVIVHGPESKTNEGLPLSVQKAISMVLSKSAKSRNTKYSKPTKVPRPKTEESRFSENKQRTRESIKSNSLNEASSDEWRPISAIGSLGRYPAISSNKAPDYLTFVPIKNYKTVVYGKPLSESQTQSPPPSFQSTLSPVQSTPSPVITKYVSVPQIQYIIKEIPVPYKVPEQPKITLAPNIKITYDGKDDISEIKISSTPAPPLYNFSKSNSIQNSPSFSKYLSSLTNTKTYIDHSDGFKLNNNFKLNALTALIGKDPEAQFKGLNKLLDNHNNNNNFVSNKENKAPLLFHPNGVKAPEPLTKLNIKVLDFPESNQANKVEPISIEEFNRLYGGEDGIKLPTDEFNYPRPFTPIHEQNPEFEYSVLPTTESYKPLSSLKPDKPMKHHDHKSGISSGYEDDSEVSK